MSLMKNLFGSAIASLLMVLPAMAVEFDQLVVIGDSNVDIGRLSAEGATPDDGVIPPANTLAGRSSDGDILPEYLSERLVVPQLNFGWGGATTGVGNIVARRGMPEAANTGALMQMDEYLAFLGDGSMANPNALYLIYAGSNDLALVDKNDQDAVDVAIRQADANLRELVQTLAERGAKYIVVANRTPRPVLSDAYIATEEPEEEARNDAAGRQLNTYIYWLVQELNDELDAEVRLFDAYYFIRELIENSGRNGFLTYDSSPDQYCINAPDCTQIINYDAAHKTSAVHKVLAQKLYFLLSTFDEAAN